MYLCQHLFDFNHSDESNIKSPDSSRCLLNIKKKKILVIFFPCELCLVLLRDSLIGLFGDYFLVFIFLSHLCILDTSPLSDTSIHSSYDCTHKTGSGQSPRTRKKWESQSSTPTGDSWQLMAPVGEGQLLSWGIRPWEITQAPVDGPGALMTRLHTGSTEMTQWIKKKRHMKLRVTRGWEVGMGVGDRNSGWIW